MAAPASKVDWEIAMVMPLGVLANQLVKIEGDLRFLSMKAAERSDETDPRPTKALDARVDLMHEALDNIKTQLLKLQADVHPKAPATKLLSHEPARVAATKPSPELDD